MAHASQQETQDIIYVALLINGGGAVCTGCSEHCSQ